MPKHSSNKFILSSLALGASVITILLPGLVLAKSERSIRAVSEGRSNLGLPSYALNVRISPQSKQLEVEGEITVPASVGDRESVEFSLSDVMDEPQVEILAPMGNAGTANLVRRSRPYRQPGWGTSSWEVRSNRPFQAGEQIVLRFRYRNGPNRSSNVFSLDEECSFGAGILTAWYPQIEESQISASGRLRGLRGTGNVTFSVPSGYVVHAPGTLASSENEQEAGKYAFKVSSPLFFSFAAAKYIRVHGSGTIPTTLYLLRPRSNAQSYIDGAARVLSLLKFEFGEYPHAAFAIVEVPTRQANESGFEGASLDGFMLANSNFLDRPFNVGYFGHEISHQWWGNLVRAEIDDSLALMLSEGLAQYGSLRAVQIVDGNLSAEGYRRIGYPGFNDGLLEFSGSRYLRLAAAGLDAPLARLPPNSTFGLIWNKGFLVWDMLANTVGREKFAAVLRDVTHQYAYQRISSAILLKRIQEIAGVDLEWFYQQWFRRAGAPDWGIHWTAKHGILHVTVAQSAPVFRADLDVEVVGTTGQRVVRQISVRSLETRLKFPVAFAVKQVLLDPHFDFLHWTPEYRAQAEALVPYTKADTLLSQGENDKARLLARLSLERIPKEDSFGLGFMLHLLLGQTLQQEKKIPEARAEIEAALASPTSDVRVLPFAYLSLAELIKEGGDCATLPRAVDNVFKADDKVPGGTGASQRAQELLDLPCHKVDGKS